MVMKAMIEGRSSEVVAADLPPDEWLNLRTEHQRVRHRVKSPLCTCCDCGYPVHPKQRGLTRFFAHNPDPDNPCPLRAAEHSETPDHRNLKLAIYRAARQEPGWDATMETIAPEKDPVTKRPVIVDVTAKRRAGQPLANWTAPIQGWEIQVSPQDEGTALERQEQRMRWLGRCTWVTRADRPAWADRIPWYQVKQADAKELVVDGVARWDPLAGDYVNEEPFPAEQMVGYILRGALWAQPEGWLLDYAAEPRARRKRQTSLSSRSTVALYCERLKRLPDYARGWTEEDWRQYAPLALDRRRRGEPLTDLDVIAISHQPALATQLDSPELGPSAPWAGNPAAIRPCIHCRQPVVVSVAADYPLHHHCAWHRARRDQCGDR